MEDIPTNGVQLARWFAQWDITDLALAQRHIAALSPEQWSRFWWEYNVQSNLRSREVGPQAVTLEPGREYRGGTVITETDVARYQLLDEKTKLVHAELQRRQGQN